jgi:hypothetical protein
MPFWLLGPPVFASCASASGADALVLLMRAVSNDLSVCAAQTLTFTVGVLPPQQDAVKFPGGAVSERIALYQAGTGAPLISSVSLMHLPTPPHPS